MTGNPTDNRKVVQKLVERIRTNAWEKVETKSSGQRFFRLDALPVISSDVYHKNNKQTAEWLQ